MFTFEKKSKREENFFKVNSDDCKWHWTEEIKKSLRRHKTIKNQSPSNLENMLGEKKNTQEKVFRKIKKQGKKKS